MPPPVNFLKFEEIVARRRLETGAGISADKNHPQLPKIADHVSFKSWWCPASRRASPNRRIAAADVKDPLLEEFLAAE